MRALAVGAAALALLATEAPAQQDTTVYDVGAIVVQATRPVTTSGGASAVELKLDSMRMPAAPTLDQILRRVPLIQVRTNSRGEAQFSLRGSGSDARQVSVIVDGIPINVGWDHRADLSVLPATAARTLTVVRGLPSLLYGPNVLSGVVEIGVAHGAMAPGRSLRLAGTVDHTGATGMTTSLNLPLRRSSADWLVRAGFGHRQRNDFARPATALPSATNNTDNNQLDGFASLSFRPTGGAWLDASASAFQAQRGIAAETHISGPRYWRYPDVRRVFAVMAGGTGMRNSLLGGLGDVELSIGIDAGHTEIDQFADDSYNTIDEEENSDDRNLTVRLRADQTVAHNGELRAGFTYSDVKHSELLNPGAVSASYHQQLWSGGLELHWIVPQLGAGTRLSAGAALDGAATPESGGKPTLGALTAWAGRAGFTSAINSHVLVHAGASFRSRFPSLRELYSGALGRFAPNPALEPEQLIAIEAGTSLQGANVELQVVAFYHRLSDAIVRIGLADGRFQRVNRDQQRGTGVEVLAGYQSGGFSFGGDLVLQHTALRDPTASVAGEPEYQPSVIAGLGLAGPLPLAARFDVRARHTGPQYCIHPESDAQVQLASTRRIDSELSRSWRLQRGWTSALELAVGVDNMTDSLSFDQCGLAQPGRTVRLQVRLR